MLAVKPNEIEASAAVDHDAARWIVRLEGEAGLGSAAELKRLLLEGVSSGRSLVLDLKNVEAVDISILQLLWAAVREATLSGSTIELRASEAMAAAMRESGFDRLPEWSAGRH